MGGGPAMLYFLLRTQLRPQLQRLCQGSALRAHVAWESVVQKRQIGKECGDYRWALLLQAACNTALVYHA